MIEIALFAAFSAFLVAAAFCDFNDLKVPNKLTAPFAAIGIGVSLLQGADIAMLAIAGALVVFLVGWAFFALGVMGGGDGKLMAAAAIWLGPYALLDFAVLIALFGGLLAATVLMFRRAESIQVYLGPTWMERLATPRPPVPYALAIAPAGIVACLRHSETLI